jgi:hypothetical protein
MKKFLVAAFAVGVIAVPSAFSAPVAKVTVCHNTGSATNPVVIIEVSGNGALNGHTGPGHHQESGDGYGERCPTGEAEGEGEGEGYAQ